MKQDLQISERQAFRIGILENIAVGMLLAPFITISSAGRYHGLAFLFGLCLIFVYGFIIYRYSCVLKNGLERELVDCLGTAGRLINVIYSVRFMLKAAVILMYFGVVIKEYLLINISPWIAIACFVVVCFYGASGDIRKRGRLMELIFWWMLVPLIIMAVFAISNISWADVSEIMVMPVNDNGGFTGILRGGYILFIAMSGIELLLFTLSHQKENNLCNMLKILIWIIIALVLAYIFIIGILGRGWVGSKGVAALNVMEASALPGKALSRMDYPVLSFWIIGIFAQVSGFIFCGKRCMNEMGGSSVTVAIILVLALFLWNVKAVSRWLVQYIYILDIAVSLVVPLLVVLVKRWRAKHRETVQ